ncbi:MAG: sigma-70 family RNA polymerase sigma factor [Chloroflexi bacterium]|nr:sigma-70 family RNA polymerase sigma factor [Chloroflexota bacterium]
MADLLTSSFPAGVAAQPRLTDAALAEIFDTYYEALYRFAFVHLRDRESAEDIAALVFQRLLDAVEAGRPPTENLRAWLYQVARRLIIDHSRRQKHRNHAPLPEALAAPVDLEALVDHELRLEQVYAALDHLNDRQREVILLRFMQGLDVEEVAAVLEISTGAVKTLQHRALTRLRRMLT